METIRKFDSEDARKKRQFIKEKTTEYSGDSSIAGIIDEIRGPDGDFSILQGICDRHLRRAGIEEKRRIRDLIFAQLPAEIAKELGMPTTATMATHLGSGIVAINDAEFQRRAEIKSIRSNVLHSLVHEVGHALGHHSVESIPEGLVEKIGVREDFTEVETDEKKIKHKKYEPLFESLNEAIVDVWAEDVAKEFALATGFVSSAKLDEFYKTRGTLGRKYGDTRRLLGAIVKKMASDTGVLPEAVKYGFIRATFEGIDLFSGDTEALLDAVVKEGFTSDLALVEMGQNLDNFIYKYKLEPFIQRLTNRILRVLNDL